MEEIELRKYAILMLMSSLIYGQGDFGGNAEIGAGLVNVNGENKAALKLSLSPEFKISKLSVGAKLGLYIGDGIPLDINGDGKRDIKDMDLGFKYIDWDGDVIKFRYGTFDDYTLGQGTLVYNYSNNEKTSLRLGLKAKDNKVGGELFFPLEKDIFGTKIDEKDQPKTMGGRVFVRPLKYTGVETPIVKNLEVGITFAKDTRDMYNTVNNDGSLGTAYTGSTEAVAYELSLPIIEKVLVPYYNRVQLSAERQDKGSTDLAGDFIGVMGKVSVLDYKIEYRNIDYGLTPGYFGRLYEVKYNQNMERAVNSPDERISGYFGELGADLGGVLNLRASYEDYNKDDIKPHLTSQIELTLSEKLHGKIVYDQLNLGDDNHKDKYFNEDTVVKANLAAPAAFIGIPGPVTANVNVEQRYNFNEAKNKYEPARTYTVGLALTF